MPPRHKELRHRLVLGWLMAAVSTLVRPNSTTPPAGFLGVVPGRRSTTSTDGLLAPA